MNTNRCVACGAEIPEGMQVCQICMQKNGVDEEYPCKGCRREEESSCWKRCVKYKKWFSKVWSTVTKRLKKKEGN